MREAVELVVVGGLNVDLTVPVTRLPAPGETVSGPCARKAAGGKGANQAVAAARLGAKVRLVGRVGDDFGPELLTAVRREGVDVSQVSIGSESTGMALIVVEEGGENMITVARGANGHLDVRDLDLTGADALLLQLEVPLEVCTAAAAKARAGGIPVILNAAPYQEGLESLLRHVDLLVVNESEAVSLCGAADPTALLALGPKAAVITLGARGAIAAEADDRAVMEVPSFQVQAVDAVGAGDTFCAQVALGYTYRQPLREAVTRACAAGALATTGHGAQSAMPTGEDVERLLHHAS
ncbi:ribokinase [Nonomuraea sp. NPDC050556]|uniref:ribokinase n=1 Tax=Nonomuraea sp. NPDC050556 TaxID=3364369 RepID=UPI00378BD366